MTHSLHFSRPLAVAAMTAILIAGVPAQAAESWSPKASEQLIKLPGDYLKKAVNNDFARSGLATALTRLDEDIALKKQTLSDLRNAVERADGELRVELQHQLLEEKRAYLEMTKEHQTLREKRARTKVRLYERLLAKTQRKAQSATPAQRQLIEQQTAARERFEASASAIDSKILQSSITSESRYAREYAKNLAAIESLAQAIQSHPMNQAPQVAGVPVSRAEYLRQLIAENEADIAVIDQERSILGYMAKLVSLDALALSENLSGADEPVVADAQAKEPEGISGSVELFVTR